MAQKSNTIRKCRLRKDRRHGDVERVCASRGELAVADELAIAAGRDIERDGPSGEQNRSALDAYRLIHLLRFAPGMVHIFPDAFNGFRRMNVRISDGNFPPAISRVEKRPCVSLDHKSFDFS